MKALNAIKWTLSKWWLLLALFIIFNVIGYLDMVDPNPLMGKVSFWGFCVSLLLLIASCIYLLIHRRWFAALFTIGVTGAVIFVTFIIAIIYSVTSDTDHFNDHLKIPVGIGMSIPAELDKRTQLTDSVKSAKPSTGLMLYNDFQPGLYQYDFWTDKEVAGDVYLKVYEVTMNLALSDDGLPESSLTHILNQGGGLSLSSTGGHFTIYEGDWGKPYAARFEVWLKPADHSDERKLFEEVYKIEGWQR